MTTIRLDDNASWILPDGDVAWRLRYGREYQTPPTDADLMHAAECMATLTHILTHPAGTESVIKQLRQARRLWRAGAERRRAP